MIKCLLTELDRAGQENLWPEVMAHGPRCARSVRHDLGPNIFPSGPPTQSISTYSCAFWSLFYSFGKTPTSRSCKISSKRHKNTPEVSHFDSFY